MLEQLVECENRLLEEQRRFNELLYCLPGGPGIWGTILHG